VQSVFAARTRSPQIVGHGRAGRGGAISQQKTAVERRRNWLRTGKAKLLGSLQARLLRMLIVAEHALAGALPALSVFGISWTSKRRLFLAASAHSCSETAFSSLRKQQKPAARNEYDVAGLAAGLRVLS
jgi:hypothetical protein